MEIGKARNCVETRRLQGVVFLVSTSVDTTACLYDDRYVESIRFIKPV